MRRYDKYKDSGIEWIGEIPEHWESIRLKYIGYLYGGLAGKSASDFNQESNFNNKPFIPFTNICNNKIIDPNQLQQVVIKENEQQNQVAKGDLFFMMSSENFDDVGKSSILLDDLGETYLNSFCKGFRFTKDKYYPPFVNYQLLSKAYRSLVLTEANGYTRINLKIDKINDIPLKTPPTLDEQITIANYLDKKTAEIDELIKQKEELLLLFEEEKIAIINQAVTKGIKPNVNLKDSGIVWLGEIPEHWNLIKLRRIVSFSQGIQVDLNLQSYSYYPGSIRFLRIENYTQNSSDFRYIDENIGRDKFVKSEDVVVVRYGASAGYICRGFDGILANNLFIVQPKNDSISKEYLFYFLKIMYPYFQLEMAGSAMPALNFGMLEEIFIPNISDKEQSEIVNYIEIENKRVNDKIQNTQVLIEFLKEYKTTLISEVATGKVKVI